MNNMGFFLREAFKNLRLNALMSATAITTTAICILILGAGMLISAHVQGALFRVSQDVEINAFFPEDVSNEEIERAQSTVEGYPEVKEVTYISKDDALERYKEIFAESPDLYEGLSADALPASLEVQLNDSGNSDAVASKLEAEGTFEDLRYPQQTIERVNEFLGYITWAMRGATALFLVASVLLIFNTIRLSIFARRKEIEVMKLVGASDGFVRTPFVLEGLVQGLIGAAIAALVVLWANSAFVSWAQEQVPYFAVSSGAVNLPFVLLVLLAVGISVGVIGSYLSVRRFMKI
jgi:cell division transport system permease protein